MNVEGSRQVEFGQQPEILPPGSKIMVVSDGADEDWRVLHGQPPLVGGVKRFTEAIVPCLRGLGFEVDFLHPYITDPEGKRIFRTRELSLYPDLEMVANNLLDVYLKVRTKLETDKPDALFITTAEGVLGFCALQAAASLSPFVQGRKLPYTLAYTTNLDQYLVEYVKSHTNSLIRLTPQSLHPVLRFIYAKASSLLVTTPTMQRRLKKMGLEQSVVWPRGIDTNLYRPPWENEPAPYDGYDWYRGRPLPILIYFGRLAVEKNLEAFLDLPTQQLETSLGTACHKVLIGNGPEKKRLEKKYGNKLTHFLGAMPPEAVAAHLRFADVFVFPSYTDTFGNVILEAGASGVPTVAFGGLSPSGVEIGSQDVIVDGLNGYKVELGKNLVEPIKASFGLDRQLIRQFIESEYSWDKAAQILLSELKQIRWK